MVKICEYSRVKNTPPKPIGIWFESIKVFKRSRVQPTNVSSKSVLILSLKLFKPVYNTFHQLKHVHSSVVCLATGPQTIPKRVLHTMRTSASYFNFQYPLFS
jgi:hypothetical protein